jgi:3-oxoacyl-[acyl-carrier-protein] synthase-3
MNGEYFDHLGLAFGDTAASAAESVALGLTRSPASAFEAAGFRTHHRCSDTQTAYDLAVAAVEPIAARLGRVGAIVYATCLPMNANAGSTEAYRNTRDVKHLMDFPASRLQAHFGLHDATVIGLDQQACTGMLGSLRLARALLRSEPALHNVLCVTADRFPAGAMYEQSYNLISDGAAACVVGREPGMFRILACHAVTNGAMSLASDDETVGSFFNYMHRTIVECLASAGLQIRDLDWIVPQNTNGNAWRILSQLLGFDFERVHSATLAAVGHVISSDNLVNLRDLARSGRLQPGNKVLLAMAGYGLNWQAVLVECV